MRWSTLLRYAISFEPPGFDRLKREHGTAGYVLPQIGELERLDIISAVERHTTRTVSPDVRDPE